MAIKVRYLQNQLEKGDKPKELLNRLAKVGSKAVIRRESQTVSHYTIYKAYQNEEEVFTNNVEVILKYKGPLGADVINSHSIYEVEKIINNLLKWEAGNAL